MGRWFPARERATAQSFVWFSSRLGGAVAKRALLLFGLQPTGLKFSTAKPAELKIRYAQADDDLNEDGEVDEQDDQIETILGIWRQEQPGQPFVRLGSVKVEEQQELEAMLTGFSRYAIAY